jgi:REP element-mobilizing transposase RayT
MHTNHAGDAVREAWEALPERFPDVECDAFMVMPNHVHGILVFGSEQEHRPLGEVVGAFKSLTVLRYRKGVLEEGWPRYAGSFWQRNYYEHVIRSEEALNRIREYIAGNPEQWADDPENPYREEGR